MAVARLIDAQRVVLGDLLRSCTEEQLAVFYGMFPGGVDRMNYAELKSAIYMAVRSVRRNEREGIKASAGLMAWA